jgi:hypothetical protein
LFLAGLAWTIRRWEKLMNQDAMFALVKGMGRRENIEGRL